MYTCGLSTLLEIYPKKNNHTNVQIYMPKDFHCDILYNINQLETNYITIDRQLANYDL